MPMQMNGKNLCGARLKPARKQKKLSQCELAQLLQKYELSLEQKSISRIEKGERFLADYELLAVCRARDISVMWVLTGEE